MTLHTSAIVPVHIAYNVVALLLLRLLRVAYDDNMESERKDGTGPGPEPALHGIGCHGISTLPDVRL